MNLKEEIQKTKNKIDDIEVRTNNITDKALRKALLLGYNENLLKTKVTAIEDGFLKSGIDYTVLKLFVENFTQLEYVYRYELKKEISNILDRNVTIKDFVSQFYDNGFLIIFVKAKENEIEEYLKLISLAISKAINKDKNMPRISQSIIQRNRHLDMKDEFIELVLNK